MATYDAELQGAVDALGADLGRATVLHDPDLRLIAYSPHLGHCDDIRLACIISRAGVPEVNAWVFQNDILSSKVPVRVQAPEEMRMDERLVAPVHWGDDLLGSLWLLDPESTLTQSEVSRVGEVANRIGQVLHVEQAKVDSLERRRQMVMDTLLAGPTETPTAWAASLNLGEFFRDATSYCVVVAAALKRGRIAVGAFPSAVIHRAATDTIRDLRLMRAACCLRDDLVVVVLGGGGVTAARINPLGLAEALQAKLRAALPADSEWRAVVGVGSVVDGPAAVATSYWQAERTLAVASTGNWQEQVLAWDRLGPLRMIAYVPPEEVASALPPGLARAMESPRGRLLLATAECFLDNAGDIQATAMQLRLHRASLYGRLQRLEDLTGFDLRDGNQRTAMHLGLKLLNLLKSSRREYGTEDGHQTFVE